MCIYICLCLSVCARARAPGLMHIGWIREGNLYSQMLLSMLGKGKGSPGEAGGMGRSTHTSVGTAHLCSVRKPQNFIGSLSDLWLNHDRVLSP